MYRDLLAHSPLLVLPIVAMLLFLGVWCVVSVRAMTRPRAEMESLARLPITEDDHES